MKSIKLTLSRDNIVKDILNLGVNQGDTIFVTADLLAVGFFAKGRKETLNAWVDILMEAVGPQGTIIVAAYTETFFRFKKNKSIIFESNTPSNSGSLSTAFLNDERSVRSKHPTNSYVGIGPNAHRILCGHDQHSLSYSPLGKIIELGGKNLMIGTVDMRNAPMAFHYAQECLGHTLHNPTNGLFQAYYKNEEGVTNLYTRKDSGGCSRGAYHLYGSLLVNNAVKFGYIGKARSALIEGKQSFDVIKEVLNKNRKIVLCDDKLCTSCYGRWSNNGAKVFWFYLYKYIVRKLFTLNKHRN